MSETGIRIVLASHGPQAQGMLETVQMLLGPQENMAAHCLSPEKSKDDLVAELQEEVAQYGAENIVFMTDLLYGTPFNSVTELTREHEIYHITGVNTITLMTAVMERGDEGATPAGVCEAAMEAAASSIVDVRRMLAEIADDDDDEDDL